MELKITDTEKDIASCHTTFVLYYGQIHNNSTIYTYLVVYNTIKRMGQNNLF